MNEKQQEKNQMEGRFSVRLLKMLYYIKAINQPTYDKAVKSLKRKEVAEIGEKQKNRNRADCIR